MAYVLIVDDDSDFASIVAKVVGRAGHETRVELGTEGIVGLLEKRCPDLMILDVMFPENNSAGFELAREIRGASGPHRHVPILMLTAVNQEYPLGFSEKDIDGDWLPVTAFLEKPIDLDVLQSKVGEILARREKGAGPPP